ncbi:MAG: hypothetical protein Q7T18_08845 [Sedimentisphaerales bacterium]|nr:hypothetical protein [Sedimentisphaerales bacterium]
MKVSKSLLVVCLVGLTVGTAMAAEQAATTAPQKSESLACPIKGMVGYTFMSDYVWRSLNLTKALGGHSGKGANVANYGLGLDLADVSEDMAGMVWVKFDQVYFNSYAGTDASLAKTDFAASYTLACPVMDGDWTLEYRNISFNEVGILRGADADTQEMSAQFAWNDGNWWKSVTGEDMGKRILNPTITYIYDYELAQGGLLLVGLSHPFDLAGISPDLDGLTLTPAPTLVVDNRYYGGMANSLGTPLFNTNENVHKTTKIAYTQFNLDLGVNLSKMMGVTSGKLMANAGIGYVSSVESFLEDTLYSYAGISYKW